MIKLKDILEEKYGGGTYSVPADHKAFMKSSKGFGCHVCKYYSKEDGKHLCSSKHFIKWNDNSNVMKIDDPSKWCSDWFEPMS